MRYLLAAMVLGVMVACFSRSHAETLSSTYWSIDESLAREKGAVAVEMSELDEKPTLRESSRVQYPLLFEDMGVDSQTLFMVLVDETGAPVSITFYYTTHPQGRMEMYREIFSFRWSAPLKDGAPVPAWITLGMTGEYAGGRTGAPYIVPPTKWEDPPELSPRDRFGHAPPKDRPRLFTVKRPRHPGDLEGPETVILQVSVSSKGNVKAVKVRHSSLPDLNERTVKAVKRWRFVPREVGNRFEEAEVLATVTYAYMGKTLVTDLQYIANTENAAPAE